jgi:hypothetical protein
MVATATGSRAWSFSTIAPITAQGCTDPAPFRVSVACWQCPFCADCTTNISERKFPTATAERRRALKFLAASPLAADVILGDASRRVVDTWRAPRAGGSLRARGSQCRSRLRAKRRRRAAWCVQFRAAGVCSHDDSVCMARRRGRSGSREGPTLRDEKDPRALQRSHCPFQDGLEEGLPRYCWFLLGSLRWY